jgi:predicted MFS family arabinose efflux permease
MMMGIEIFLIVYGAWFETAFTPSPSELGIVSGVVGLAEAGAELSTTVITDRLGKRRSVLVGLSGLAISLAILPLLSRLGQTGALVGIALILVTFEFGLVSFIPLTTELAPDARASLLSLNVMISSLGRVLGAQVGGWLWRWESIGLHMAAGIVCMLVAAAMLLWGVPEIEA